MPTIETNADAETTMRLYRAIEAARAAAADKGVPVRDRPTSDRAAYMREAKRGVVSGSVLRRTSGSRWRRPT